MSLNWLFKAQKYSLSKMQQTYSYVNFKLLFKIVARKKHKVFKSGLMKKIYDLRMSVWKF
jgi:hypothetical protein